MSEDEIGQEITRTLLRIEGPLSRIEAQIAAGDPVPEPVRQLARNLRAAIVRFDAEA